MANPVFSRSPIFSAKAAARAADRTARAHAPAQLADAVRRSRRPSPDEMGRMTYEDTIVKTAVSFGVLLVGAVIGWVLGDLPDRHDRRRADRPRARASSTPSSASRRRP